MKKLLTVAYFLSSSYLAEFAFCQFEGLTNPSIQLSIYHPPSLGFTTKKVIVNAASGSECSDALTNQTVSIFVNGNVEVIDRANLDKILEEQKFMTSAYIDQSTAIKIGKIIGPSALVTLKVIDCRTFIKENLYEDVRKYNADTKQYYVVREYITRTELSLKVSVQTTDLATGRIFSAQVFDASRKQENRSTTGKPEAPDPIRLQDFGIQSIVGDINRMFFGWSQPYKCIFFDNKEGDLISAFNLLKGGQTMEALKKSKECLSEYLESEKPKERILANAKHNVGMAYLALSQHDSALVYLRGALALKNRDATSDAIKFCEQAKRAYEKVQQMSEKADMETKTAQLEQEKKETAQQSATLSNKDVIEMFNKKIPVSIIKRKIATSPAKFDLSTAGITELIGAGVPEDIVSAMMEKQ